MRTEGISAIGKWAAIVIGVLGALLRIVVYFQNRSLFLDEANLARNIVEKDWAAFFQPLSYHQYAPPLFCTLSKTGTLLLGNNEYGLRFIPLLASLAGLWLLFKIVQTIFQNPWTWTIPLFLFAFAEPFVRFATETKQYSVDTFATLLLLFLCLKQPVPFSSRDWWKWALLGIVLPWLSMSSVFMLSGIGLYWLYQFWQKQSWPVLQRMLLLILSWLLSFGAYYALILSTDLDKDYLTAYHSTYFMPLLPTTGADVAKAGRIWLSLFRTGFGYTVLAYLIGIISFGVGILFLYRHKRAWFLLFLAPLGACLLASGLGYYSLMPRLTLGIIPLFWLVAFYPIDQLLQKGNAPYRWLVLVPFLSLLPLQKGINSFFQPYSIEEIRPVLQYVAQNQQADEQVFIHEEAIPAVTFYRDLHDRQEDFQIDNAIYGYEYQSVLEGIPEAKQEAIWLVFSHNISDYTAKEIQKNRALLSQSHQLADQFERQGAVCYLFTPTP